MTSTTSRTLMIIDDSQIDNMMHNRIIGREGIFETILCYTYAEEALEYLLNKQEPMPDIILLDINMPCMDGFEFLEKASELPEDIQSMIVIMLTTSPNQKDKSRANEFDMVKGYLVKPLSVESFKNVIPQLL